jgi:hypothetical protein
VARRDQQPDRPLRQPQADLGEVPFALPEPQTRVAVALDPALDQNEEVGPDGLRAGIAAPDPAQRRGEQEQAEPRHDQQARDEVELVRPDLDPEEEEAPVGEVDQHRLIGQVRAAVPADPRRQVVDAQRDDHDPPFEVPELAGDTRENGLTCGVENNFSARETAARSRIPADDRNQIRGIFRHGAAAFQPRTQKPGAGRARDRG